MSAVYLVLMRHSNKKKQPNCFDFIIIVVAGLFTSFSCQRRENIHKHFTDILEFKYHDRDVNSQELFV